VCLVLLLGECVFWPLERGNCSNGGPCAQDEEQLANERLPPTNVFTFAGQVRCQWSCTVCTVLCAGSAEVGRRVRVGPSACLFARRKASGVRAAAGACARRPCGPWGTPRAPPGGGRWKWAARVLAQGPFGLLLRLSGWPRGRKVGEREA